MCQICRRSFMRGAAALGAAGATGLLSSPLMAQAAGEAGASKLPPRGEFTITGAYVMTMDGTLGDIAGGSVHVRNGEIVAVGKDIAGGGEKIDGAGMIVMPGLVETHWHMWNTIFRSFAGDRPEEGYFPTVARFGAQMTPDDIFQSTRLSAAEAINSGMTFAHSWCHNVRSTAHAEADIRALAEIGIRARHSCGWPQGLPDTQSADQAPIETLARDSENAKAENEFKMTARKALELGTIDGARSMGIDDKVGSLTPGKRADLIAISPNALNMAVVSDPAHLVLEATGPENVDTVVVDGRILKRGGKLTALDTSEIIAGARAALAGVRERTKWR